MAYIYHKTRFVTKGLGILTIILLHSWVYTYLKEKTLALLIQHLHH